MHNTTRLILSFGRACPSETSGRNPVSASEVLPLSILELRRYHMREQLERDDASQEHREKVAQKMVILDQQRDHLVTALDRLLQEIFSGKRPLRVFRQMKMYNDPAMNPYLYKSTSRLVS